MLLSIILGLADLFLPFALYCKIDQGMGALWNCLLEREGSAYPVHIHRSYSSTVFKGQLWISLEPHLQESPFSPHPSKTHISSSGLQGESLLAVIMLPAHSMGGG